MPETTEAQKLKYPLPAYNFRVSIDGATISCAEVSGINLEYETVTYRHGLSAWEGENIKKYQYEKFFTITLKKGTVHGTNHFYEWIKETRGARSVDVSLCDEKGVPVVTWHIRRAVPVKLEAPTFDAKSNDVSIESLELMASGVTIEHH